MTEPTVESVSGLVLDAIFIARGMLSRGAKQDPMGTDDLAACDELLSTYERELTDLLLRLRRLRQKAGEPPAPTQ